MAPAFRQEHEKFKDEIRKKTKRTNGHNLEFIIEDVNRTLR